MEVGGGVLEVEVGGGVLEVVGLLTDIRVKDSLNSLRSILEAMDELLLLLIGLVVEGANIVEAKAAALLVEEGLVEEMVVVVVEGLVEVVVVLEVVLLNAAALLLTEDEEINPKGWWVLYMGLACLLGRWWVLPVA